MQIVGFSCLIFSLLPRLIIIIFAFYYYLRIIGWQKRTNKNCIISYYLPEKQYYIILIDKNPIFWGYKSREFCLHCKLDFSVFVKDIVYIQKAIGGMFFACWGRGSCWNDSRSIDDNGIFIKIIIEKFKLMCPVAWAFLKKFFDPLWMRIFIKVSSKFCSFQRRFQ